MDHRSCIGMRVVFTSNSPRKLYLICMSVLHKMKARALKEIKYDYARLPSELNE